MPRAAFFSDSVDWSAILIDFCVARGQLAKAEV
jgi:hypothetical protein